MNEKNTKGRKEQRGEQRGRTAKVEPQHGVAILATKARALHSCASCARLGAPAVGVFKEAKPGRGGQLVVPALGHPGPLPLDGHALCNGTVVGELTAWPATVHTLSILLNMLSRPFARRPPPFLSVSLLPFSSLRPLHSTGRSPGCGIMARWRPSAEHRPAMPISEPLGLNGYAVVGWPLSST